MVVEVLEFSYFILFDFTSKGAGAHIFKLKTSCA
jgi:hypothetical protein